MQWNISRKLFKLFRPVGLILIIIASILFIGHFILWIGDGGSYPLGENMVNYELNIIPGILMMKPITFSIVVGTMGYLLVLESIENPYRVVSEETMKLIEAISIFFLFISLYEILFNFMYWGAAIATLLGGGEAVNIDLIASKFQYSKYSWNLVFATKLFFMIFFFSILTLVFINRWRKASQTI